MYSLILILVLLANSSDRRVISRDIYDVTVHAIHLNSRVLSLTMNSFSNLLLINRFVYRRLFEKIID